MDCESTYPETNVTGDWPPPLVGIPHLVTVNLVRVALRHGPYICRLSNVRMCPHSLTAQKKSRLADYIGKRYEKLSTYFICNRVPYFPFPFSPTGFRFSIFPVSYRSFPVCPFSIYPDSAKPHNERKLSTTDVVLYNIRGAFCDDALYKLTFTFTALLVSYITSSREVVITRFVCVRRRRVGGTVYRQTTSRSSRSRCPL